VFEGPKSLIKLGWWLQSIHKVGLIKDSFGQVVKDLGGAGPPGRSFGCVSIYVGWGVSVPHLTPDQVSSSGVPERLGQVEKQAKAMACNSSIWASPTIGRSDALRMGHPSLLGWLRAWGEARHTIADMSHGFACPCCGNLTLGEQPPGTYWNCVVCGWEDHPGTVEDLEFVCGTNGVGLHQARENYKQFGASDRWLVPKVRKPLPEELP
jgi:hypothetical protein